MLPFTFIPAFAKNILHPFRGINALLSGFAWCEDAALIKDQRIAAFRARQSQRGLHKFEIE